MHPFTVLVILFAILSLMAFVPLLHWERRYFMRREKSGAWLRVRLATIPIALGTAAMAIIPARNTAGMEGLAVFYVMLLVVGPVFWFGAHWIVGKLARPRLTFGESSLIAVSPIIFTWVVAVVAHALQPIAWSVLRSMGKA